MLILPINCLVKPTDAPSSRANPSTAAQYMSREVRLRAAKTVSRNPCRRRPERALLCPSLSATSRNASTTPLAGTADGRRWAGGAGRGPRFAGLTRPRNSRGRGLVAPRMIWPSAHGGRAEGLSAPEGLPRVGELRAARRREGGSSSGAARAGSAAVAGAHSNPCGW